jgi:hypothetical protein
MDFGSGSVANPTTNKNNALLSITAAGDPPGDGHSYFTTRMAQNIKASLGAYSKLSPLAIDPLLISVAKRNSSVVARALPGRSDS